MLCVGLQTAMSRLWEAWATLFGSICTIFVLTCIFVPPVIVLVLLVAFAMSYLYKRYAVVACELQNLTMLAMSPLVGALGSLLGALDTIRIFGRLDHFVNKFKADQRHLCKCYYWNWSLDRFVMCWCGLLIFGGLVAEQSGVKIFQGSYVWGVHIHWSHCDCLT